MISNLLTKFDFFYAADTKHVVSDALNELKTLVTYYLIHSFTAFLNYKILYVFPISSLQHGKSIATYTNCLFIPFFSGANVLKYFWFTFTPHFKSQHLTHTNWAKLTTDLNKPNFLAVESRQDANASRTEQ
jgi:hypothetical protein